MRYVMLYWFGFIRRKKIFFSFEIKLLGYCTVVESAVRSSSASTLCAPGACFVNLVVRLDSQG